MSSLKVTLKLDASGPLADGQAERLVGQWLENTTQALADEGVAMLRQFPLDKTGRATGAFQDSLKTVRKSPSQVSVPGPQEKGIAWSPWLEGTTARNADTKFKGYRLFAKTRLELQKRAPEIGQAELGKLIAGMGGE